jgi:hypothetical protein
LIKFFLTYPKCNSEHISEYLRLCEKRIAERRLEFNRIFGKISSQAMDEIGKQNVAPQNNEPVLSDVSVSQTEEAVLPDDRMTELRSANMALLARVTHLEHELAASQAALAASQAALAATQELPELARDSKLEDCDEE